MATDLLQVQNLVTTFSTDGGRVRAVDDVSFSIQPGQTVGLVGESGSGKSVTSLSVMRLIPTPPGEIVQGKILFEGRDILALPESEMRKLRGNSMGMIFQEPMTSLNPVFTIGHQIAEVFEIHQGLSRKDAFDRSVEMLRLVKIPAPDKRAKEYPHQLSGGMRQRVMIAMALACRPKLLIADEPTTALDVTIQAQILDLMCELQQEIGMAILMITHDLGVVAEVCDYVMVMYGGRVVERGPTAAIFRNPMHPYTRGLLSSIPVLGRKVEYLPTIPGAVPSLSELGLGCHFHGRCDRSGDRCRVDIPPVKAVGQNGDHSWACWNSTQ